MLCKLLEQQNETKEEVNDDFQKQFILYYLYYILLQLIRIN